MGRTTSLQLLGNEQQPVIVVDNFAPSARGLIDYALAHGQVQQDAGLYPGVRSPAPAAYTRFVLEQVNSLRQHYLDEATPLHRGESYFSLVTTPAGELSPAQRVPHFDRPQPAEYAVMHFLCGSEHGGTAFYRHRSSGFEYIDQARQQPYLTELEGQMSRQPPQGYINGDTPLFEQLAEMAASFNRALIYRCSSLHSGCIAPDYVALPDPWAGRFTLTSFLA